VWGQGWQESHGICGNGYSCCGNTAGIERRLAGILRMEFIAAGNSWGMFEKTCSHAVFCSSSLSTKRSAGLGWD